MKRIALALASLTLACAVGPEYIGDTAEDSTAADESGETTSHCGDSCGELQWTVPLAPMPACLRIDADDDVQVLLDRNGASPSAVRTFDASGTEVGTAFEIPRPADAQLWDCFGSPDGFALVQQPPPGGPQIQLVPGDLMGTPTSITNAMLDAGPPHSIVVAGDGTLRVAGMQSEIARPIVFALDQDGTLEWSWTDTSASEPPLDGATKVLAGLGADDVLVWTFDTTPPTVSYVVHLDGAGEELARTELPVPAIWITYATRSGDGWLIAGTETATGGIFLARLDAQLAVGAHVLDPTAAPGDQIAAVRLVPTDHGATLISSGLFDGKSIYQVRRYDDDLALVSITDVTSPHPDARFDGMEDAVVGPDGVVYLAMGSEIGTPGASNFVGWLARVVP